VINQVQDGNIILLHDGGASLQDAVISKARLKEAEDEQSGAKNLASTAAMKTAIQGVQSLVAARVAKTMANQAKDNAKEARENDALAAQAIFNYDANQLAPGTTTGYDPNAAAISGTTSSSTSDTTELTDQDLPTGPMLGTGNDLGGGDDSLSAPVAGKFKGGSGSAGGAASSPGGGAAGGGGGGGGSPAGQEESKAAYASGFETKERYESGGGAPGARGAGGKGGKDDSGIDLNGLLAQFLPKSEEDLGSKNGILDAVGFGGARNIANEEPASLLDKNADLFQRIHDTSRSAYSNKSPHTKQA
jgi:hypothetical protein